MFNLWKIRRERKSEEVIFSPLSGKVLRLEDVPDPAFSKKMAGWGIAVDPSEGRVVSPVDGEVVHIFRTKHAVWIRSGSGLDLLIHIGLDTVNMDGEGFRACVEMGDRVSAGEPVIDFSIELVRRKATSPITPMLIANPDRIARLDLESPAYAEMGITPLLRVRLKS